MSLNLWSIIPLNDISETVLWKTNVMKNRAGETRVQVRDEPRFQLSCNYLFDSEDQFSQAKYYAQQTEPEEVQVPWWPYWAEDTGILAGDSAVSVANADEMYEAGDTAILTDGTNEVTKTVLSATSTTLTFTATIGQAFSSAIICPVIDVLVSSFNFSREPGLINRASVTFLAKTIFYSGDQPYGLDGGFPLVDDETEIVGSISEEIAKRFFLHDGDVGGFSQFDLETYVRHDQTLQFMPFGYTDRRKIRRFVLWMRGQLYPFKIYTWANETDAPEKTLVRSASDRIEFRYHDWDTFDVAIPCTEVLA